MTTDFDYTYGLEVGDLVTTYHKGVWRVTDVERRFVQPDDRRLRALPDTQVGDEYNALIHYHKVLNGDFKPVKTKSPKNCDASFCTKLDDAWAQSQRDELERKISVIRQFRNP